MLKQAIEQSRTEDAQSLSLSLLDLVTFAQTLILTQF